MRHGTMIKRFSRAESTALGASVTRAMATIIAIALVVAACSQAQATPTAGQATGSLASVAAPGGSTPAASTPVPAPTTPAPTLAPTPTAPPTPSPTEAPSTPAPTNAAIAGGTLPGGSGCPKRVRRLEDVTSVPVGQRAGCFGSVTLTLIAFAPVADMDIANCPPDPALEPGDCTPEPGWLIGAYWVIAGDTAGDATAPNVLVAAIDPSSGAVVPEGPIWVRVVGHFDDAASSSCRFTVDATGKLAEPAKTTIARCRSTFVATSVEPASAS